jgi:hypothetical protein
VGSFPSEVTGFFFNSPNPSGALWPSGPLRSTRNLPRGKVWPVRKADNSQPSTSQLSRKCRSFGVSQHYEPPQPVTGIALLFLTFYNRETKTFVTEPEGLTPPLDMIYSIFHLLAYFLKIHHNILLKAPRRSRNLWTQQ